MRRCINIEDLSGRTFGRLKVMERDYKKKIGKVEYYRCECRCGNNNYVTTAKELLGGKGSCGCIEKYKGFNDYRVEGNIVYIKLNSRGGYESETLIDIDDLDKVKQYGHWHLSYRKNNGQYYASHSFRFDDENGKRKGKTILMHKIIKNAKGKEKVDHINHSTLDNRKNNLRITENKENTKNRKSKNANNKSGYRNVYWITKDERWVVSLQIDGKAREFGRFKLEDLAKAGVRAEEMRQLHYKEYAGIS